ncbi:MAG: M36 family metallopeptidase [Emticicia sp.]
MTITFMFNFSDFKTKITAIIAVMLCSISTYAQKEIEIAKNYLTANAAKQNLTAADMNEMQISSAYLSPTTGWYHVYFAQTHQSVEVYNALLNLTLKNGNVEYVTSSFVQNLAGKVTVSPLKEKLSPVQAIRNAAMSRNLTISNLSQIEELSTVKIPSGLITKAVYRDQSLSDEPINVQLYWLPYNTADGEKKFLKVALTWNVRFLAKDGKNSWNIQVDAITGNILSTDDDIIHCNFGTPQHQTTPHVCVENQYSTPQNLAVLAPNQYNVFDIPLESPLHGSRTVVTSPYTKFVPTGTGPGTTNGWHNDGTTDYTTTRGNNVWAQEDANANNGTGGSPISATLDFNYSYTQGLATAAGNQNAAITNLFYWNNLIHDVLWKYGFDEPGGNFQKDNVGRGGAGNDFIYADAQDGAGVNNANFSTPVDGGNGRMQMFLWNTSNVYQPDGDFDNGIIAHEYGHGWSIRLTGGPANSSCLGNAEQGGEGWSDYAALMLTTNWASLTPSLASANLPRGIGTYALGQPITGTGIRPYRYSYDMANVNSLVTYAKVSDESNFSRPHGIGSIWATMLWDMTWEIILQDNQIVNNIYTVPANIADMRGNIAALKLVNEGLRLQPCSPSFVDARNAILQADQMLFGGRYRCAIGRAFARRGLGFFASSGSSSNDRVVVEDFTLFSNNLLTSPTSMLSVCSNTPLSYTATTAASGVSYNWTRPAIAGISNAAASGSSANINESLINTTTYPILVKYYFTISPDACNPTPSAQSVSVLVNPFVTPTVASYTVCQNGTVPNGQGLVVPLAKGNTVTGTLVAGGTTYRRGDNDNTSSYVASNIGSAVYYKTYTFVASASGTLDVETIGGTLTGDPYDTYLTLYQTAFNPAAPATNFLKGDDDSGALLYASKLTHPIIAGTTYILVVSTYFNGVIGSFTLQSNQAIFADVNNWYLASSGGSPLATGEVFNPVGVAGSGIANTATVGSNTFYVTTASNTTCRTPVVFNIGVAAATGVGVSATAICSGTSLTLTATCSVGTVTWYNQLTGGVALGTGNSLVQNPTVNTTYYAECKNGQCASVRSATSAVEVNPTTQSIVADISSGTSTVVVTQTITAINKVMAPANVTYRAGKSVSLNAGFQVNASSVFKAEIGGCN